MADFAVRRLADTSSWCVALSGGPDSLALVATAAPVRSTTALIVDHGLQPGSDTVAEAARRQALELGCAEARVLRVTVGARYRVDRRARLVSETFYAPQVEILHANNRRRVR